MSETRLKLKKTREFAEWYLSLEDTQKARINVRLDNLTEGHFGVSRSLGDGLFELKWRNGLRIYYSRKRIAGIDLIVLWGGFKGSQRGDIARARRLKDRYEYEFEKEEG